MANIRIDKFLADCGIGTRSEVKNLLKKKLIKINDNIITSPNTKLNTDSDKVYYQDKLVTFEEYEYFMLNKPKGYVSATNDNVYPTVIDLIKTATHKGLFPVGRLDVDTEGLLIITDDGETAHRLLSPAHHVDKCYYAELDKPADIQLIEEFKKGFDIGEEKITQPAKLEILDNPCQVLITIHEGKFHQIKRMFKHFNLEVIYLKRLSMASLSLDETLQTGEYRKLTAEEIELLRRNR